MTGNAYAAAKALRHLDIIENVRGRVPGRPASIYLVVSDICNQDCVYCIYRDPTHPSSQHFLDGGQASRHVLDADKVNQILVDCYRMSTPEHCVAVQFTGGGEPTTHPQFAQMLRWTQDLGLPYSVATNGVLVRDREMIEQLARASWLRFSIDSADEATYHALRRAAPGHFARAWAAVADVAEAREGMGRRPRVTIGVNCVVGPENWAGVVETARMARAMGADNINLAVRRSAQGTGLFAGFREQMLAACREAEGLATPTFQVYNRIPERLAELESGPPTFAICGHSLFSPYIAADGNVYRCCDVANNDAGLVGSIEHQRFMHLWLSQRRIDAMLAFDARTCPYCPFYMQGQLMDYTLGPAALHEEFV